MLFSAKGRIRRREWWLYTFAWALIAWGIEAALILSGKSTEILQLSVQKHPVSLTLWDAYFIVLLTVGQVPVFCINAKRWHDRNRPGYLALIGFVIAFSNLALILSKTTLVGNRLNIVMEVSALVSTAYSVWLLIDCGILDGSKGDNKFGSSPKVALSQVEPY